MSHMNFDDFLRIFFAHFICQYCSKGDTETKGHSVFWNCEKNDKNTLFVDSLLKGQLSKFLKIKANPI